MSTFLYLGPNLIPSASRTLYPFPQRAQSASFSPHKPFLRESLGVARFGLGQIQLPDPESAQGLIGDLFSRAESLLYTITDAAVSGSSSDTVTTTTAATNQSSDWLSGVTNTMEVVLKVLKDGLSTLHVPYAYGFAIILLTILVKAATFPLTKKQVESAMAMRSLQPQIKAIQQRYAGDQERIQLETARLYKLAGINPLAGCLPTLATIPIWIGLYRALSNVANEGLLTEGFFWIPSLAGPTTVAARQTGSGTSWLFPFVDGHPPLGWSDTLAYLVLPVLLVISQYFSVQIMQSSQSNDPSLKSSQAITKFLPLMIGYFALSVPSGLSLYWFTNNILSTAQQVWLQKLGGAKNPMMQFIEDSDKEQQSQTQKSIFEATTTTRKEAKGEKSVAEGPRPGERFKQIKEQEARRRRKREQEKGKAEEAAASGIQKTDQLKIDENIVEKGNKDEINIPDARDRSVNSFGTSSYSSNVSYHVVDGDSSSFEEDQKDSIPRKESSETSVNREGAINLHENQDKEKAVARMGTSDDKRSGEDSHQERTE